MAFCMQPDISMAPVAMINGLNASLLRRWVQAAERRTEAALPPALPAPKRPTVQTAAVFIPMQLLVKLQAADIRIELRRGATAITSTVRIELCARPADDSHRDDLAGAGRERPARGIDILLGQVLRGFAEVAQAHHADVFANRRADRLKVLVYDGVGMWLFTRRLQAGGFVWPRDESGALELTRKQFDWLVVGLPWQRLSASPPQRSTVN